MSDFKSLKVLDKFEFIFQKANIDYKMMRHILYIKLLMDARRVPTIFNEAKDQSGNQFLKSLWIYALMGLILIPFLFGDEFIFQMSILFSIVMFIVMTSMISDFSSVLLDVRDKMVLSTKPVDSKTINAAKVIHITIYLVFLSAAFVGIPLIVGLFKHGIIFFLISLISFTFINILVLILTAIVYITILRFFDGEKLKDIINYIQILLSISMVVGYQLVARSFNFVNLDISFTFEWWHIFMPPIWYGTIYEMAMNGVVNQSYIILATLGIVVPFLALALYVKLIPSFERNLEKLLSNGGKHKEVKDWWMKLWSRLLVRKKQEKIFFDFAGRMIRNERDYKLKVYPSIAMALAFPFIFIINDLILHNMEEIQEGNMYFAMYVCFIMIPAGVQMLQYSSTEKGAWIYRTAPIEDIRLSHRATLKAFFVKLFIPVYFILTLIFLVMFSERIIPFLIGLLLSASVFGRICYKTFFKNSLPFSVSFKIAQNKQAGEALGMLALIVLFGVIHYVANIFPYGLIIHGLVLLVINLLIWRK
ncbi:hypothetical protein [Gracilibacillus massiliensis]|uniref:hypothetical protein n=1 Tax=Gracilibacillus massiliensis TaxID=1564956 RepID=UPI00071DC355|nr:hypothetical protein [Gracilibacillus massiliensis]